MMPISAKLPNGLKPAYYLGNLRIFNKYKTSENLVDELVQLTETAVREFSFDPNIPTAIRRNEFVDIVRTAAQILLAVYGTPAGAAAGLKEMFDKLFARLDKIEETLDRIEQGVKRIEEKIDAALLAKFHAGLHELRDGMRARRQDYGTQLILSARNKLMELAELPHGITYSGVPSEQLSSASCLLIAIIDTWCGELTNAQIYNLRALVANPGWSEPFLFKNLIRSLGALN